MGQTRPFFVYFRPFLNTTTNMLQNLTINGRRIDGIFEIWTQDRRMVGADKSTELWRPCLLNIFWSSGEVDQSKGNVGRLSLKSVNGFTTNVAVVVVVVAVVVVINCWLQFFDRKASNSIWTSELRLRPQLLYLNHKTSFGLNQKMRPEERGKGSQKGRKVSKNESCQRKGHRCIF